MTQNARGNPPVRRPSRRPGFRFIVQATALSVGLSLLSGVPQAPPAAADPKPKADQLTAERPDRVSAVLTARQQKSRVEITGERTETSSTWANPDGTLTTEVFSGPVRVRNDMGDLVPIDLSLVADGKVLRPKAGPAEVGISATGGKDPFATLEQDDKSLSVSWPSELGEPEVSGNTATFKDAVPGGDLVVQALKSGLRYDLVLRERPTGPLELRLPIKTKGLKLAQAKHGGLTVTDGKDRKIASGPTPRMWEAGAGKAALSPAAEGRSAKMSTKVETGQDGQVLVLKPDAGFLADPATQYPVTVDPTLNLAPVADAAVYSLEPNTNYGSAATMDVGSWTNMPWRGLVKFDASALTGKKILSAKLNMRNLYAKQCADTGAGVQIRRATSSWSASTVTWNTQPTTTADGAAVSTDSHGFDSSCPSGVMPFDATAIAQAWADGQPNHGLALQATPETDPTGFRVFTSSENTNPPALQVTYNTAPATPTGLALTPYKVWNNTNYSGTNPELLAVATDPESGAVRLDFEAVKADGTPLWSRSSSFVPSGQEATVTLPPGLLSNAMLWKWRVRAFDGHTYSAWTSYSDHRVDGFVPHTPTIWCEYEYGVWNAARTDEVRCTVDTISDDGEGYQWSIDNSNPTEAVTNNGGGSPGEFWITPKDGWHAIYAQAHDGLGNLSATAWYHFGVGIGGLVTPVDDDRTQRFAPLTASAVPAKTGVTYKYRPAHHDQTTWGEIPVADITVPGTGQNLSAWPFPRSDTGKDFTQLDWDVTKSLARWGKGDGPVEVKACYSGNSSGMECTAPNTIIVERTSFGASQAVGNIGPGQLSLHTGDFSVDQTDVNVNGLAVDRGHTTLNPGIVASGPFGPGWSPSFPDPVGGVGGLKFEDHSAEGYVNLVETNGSISTYVIDANGKFTGIAEAADTGELVKNSATQFTFTSPDDVKTVFIAVNGIWSAASVDAPGDEVEQTYHRDTAGRVVKILGAAPQGVTCTTSTLNPGCVALTLTYATSTTATGLGSGWGAVNGQVSKIDYTAYDLETGSMRTVTVASYLYDSSGRLRQTWDPRISPNLFTTYYYNGHGRLSQVTPPGQSPWTLEYDSTKNRVAHISRVDDQNREIRQAIVYDVPIAGQTAPINLSATQTGTWAQTSDLPVEGSALFPPSHVPPRNGDGSYRAEAGDWKYARIAYQDVNGRTVNAAKFGAGAWQISARRHNSTGEVVWSLSAENRAQALVPTDSTDVYVRGRNTSAERADLLASVTEYGSRGEPLSETGPAHRAVLDSGATVSARNTTTYTYDEGRPKPGPAPIVTTMKVFPTVIDGTAVSVAADTKTTVTGYAPIVGTDPSGWDLAMPTTITTVVPGATDIVKRTRYDSDGRTIEMRMPASGGTDAGTTLTYYYTAGTHPQVQSCGLKPNWAGKVCRTVPAAQPTGNPLPTTTFTYGYYGQPVKVTSTAGGTTRTSVSSFDAAGRPTRSSLQVTPAQDGGTAIPDTVAGYDQQNGLVSTTSAGDKTLSTTHDSFGRVISYTDAGGNTATTTYNVDGQVATLNDGKGTYTYTYDGADNRGREERRGLVTAVDMGIPNNSGVVTFAYNGDGQSIGEWYGFAQIWAGHTYDATGKETQRAYGKDSTSWLSFGAGTFFNGQKAWSSGPAGRVDYRYDKVGRLSEVYDTYQGECTTRLYAFSVNTNRTAKTTHGPAANGECTTSTTPISENDTYDAADRLNSAGYTYDNLGRTLTVPGTDVSGGADLQIGYHSNDMVSTLTQGTQTRTFSIDPANRIHSMQSGPGTEVVNHYFGSSDSPAWIAEAGGAWTRNLTGSSGLSAIQKSDGTVTLQLSNLHGDVVATTANSPTASLGGYWEQTEYGVPRAENTTNPTRYGWLGSHQRSSDALGGLILMGVRLYNPTTGRFLSVDSVQGGNANAYEYGFGDPQNNLDLDGRFSYTYEFPAGYRPELRPANAMRWILTHFNRAFPFKNDCGQNLHLNEVCRLDIKRGPDATVKTHGIGQTYFRFVALGRHFEPKGSKISFKIFRKAGDKKNLYLRIHAYGPNAEIHGNGFTSPIAKGFAFSAWGRFAENLRRYLPRRATAYGWE